MYKPDHLAQRAKKEGYLARSVYKLQEIHKKHLHLEKFSTFLDLGAAPGSWTQYLLRTVPPSSSIVAIDKKPLSLRSSRGIKLHTLQGDFTEKETLEQLIAMGPYDVILSDAAPDTCGNRLIDTSRSEEIVRSVFSIAKQSLKKNHFMVAKVFQGEGNKELLNELRSYFSCVRRHKPTAVRSTSFEEFIVCN